MATLILATNHTSTIQPANGKDFKLAELYAILDVQYIELIYLDNKTIMVAA